MKFLLESTPGMNAKIQDRKANYRLYDKGRATLSKSQDLWAAYQVFPPYTLWHIWEEGLIAQCLLGCCSPRVPFPPFLFHFMSLSHCQHPLQFFPGSTMMHIFITSPQRLSGPHPTQTLTGLPKSAVQSNALECSKDIPG